MSYFAFLPVICMRSQQEHVLKSQLEREKASIEGEKAFLVCSLQEQMDRTTELKNDLLKFQATHEKHSMLIESLRAQVRPSELSSSFFLFFFLFPFSIIEFPLFRPPLLLCYRSLNSHSFLPHLPFLL